MISPATRTSWQTLDVPAEREHFDISMTFDDAQGAKLRLGFIPRDMGDKWFIFLEDGWLYFHRSWTGDCIFGLKIDDTPAGLRAVDAWVSRDRDRYNPIGVKHERQLIFDLIHSRLLAE